MLQLLTMFVIHLGHGDFEVTRDTIEEVTQIPFSPHHVAPLPIWVWWGCAAWSSIMVFEQIPHFVTFIALDVGFNAVFWVFIIQLPSTDLHFKLFTASWWGNTLSVSTPCFCSSWLLTPNALGVQNTLPVIVTRLCRNFLPDAEFIE